MYTTSAIMILVWLTIQFIISCQCPTGHLCHRSRARFTCKGEQADFRALECARKYASDPADPTLSGFAIMSSLRCSRWRAFRERARRHPRLRVGRTDAGRRVLEPCNARTPIHALDLACEQVQVGRARDALAAAHADRPCRGSGDHKVV